MNYEHVVPDLFRQSNNLAYPKKTHTLWFLSILNSVLDKSCIKRTENVTCNTWSDALCKW